MRVLVFRGVVCLIALIVPHTPGPELRGTGLVATAQAESVPKATEQVGTDAEMRSRRNSWTVGVAGGQLSGTYMTFANELAEVLDDGDNLRVLPIVTYGAASNVDDLLYLRQVDVAVTQSDVFEYFRTQRKISNLQYRVNYIIRLPVSEVHMLARTDIRTIEDLRGKKVSFGPAGSASSLTGTIVFQRLGIQVEQACRQCNRTAKAQVRRDRRAGSCDRQADRLLCEDPGEFGIALRPDFVLEDLFRLLHARRTHQQGISETGAGGTDGRHHRGSGGARGLQLAERQRSLSAG